MLPALERLLDDDPIGDIHVVASGDPLLHGIGATLIRLHGADRVRVLPHVSSVTLACARMGWAAQDTEVISLVTAPVHTAVRRGGRAVVLCRDAATPAALAAAARRNRPRRIGVHRPGTTRRRRASGSAAARPTPGRPRRPPTSTTSTSSPSATCPTSGSAGPCPTTLFQHDGQITKQTIRAVTLAALAPRPGELLWDVGSGSGSIAVEWCRSAPGLPCGGLRDRPAAPRADRRQRPRLRRRYRRSAARHRRTSTARAQPDVIFIGGGLTTPGLVEACLGRLPAGGRLVANAVTAESEALLVEWYSRLGGELRRFQHYRGEPLGGFTGWRPQMPITQWRGERDAVTVYFIGAGPGAADLITVRGQRLLQRCAVCLYAGSIMPDDLLALCPPDARIVDTGPLTLEQIIDEIAARRRRRPRRGPAALR